MKFNIEFILLPTEDEPCKIDNFTNAKWNLIIDNHNVCQKDYSCLKDDYIKLGYSEEDSQKFFENNIINGIKKDTIFSSLIDMADFFSLYYWNLLYEPAMEVEMDIEYPEHFSEDYYDYHSMHNIDSVAHGYQLPNLTFGLLDNKIRITHKPKKSFSATGDYPCEEFETFISVEEFKNCILDFMSTVNDRLLTFGVEGTVFQQCYNNILKSMDDNLSEEDNNTINGYIEDAQKHWYVDLEFEEKELTF